MELELPLARAAIMAIDRPTFDEVLRIARTGSCWDPRRRDAQRTLHRGLDYGVFGLDRNLRIRLVSDMDEAGNYVGPESSGPTTMGNDLTMNATDFLEFAPKLSDGPIVTAQPSLKEIVHEHYRRNFGDEQGDAIARSYLERIVATYPGETAADAASPSEAAPRDASAEAPVMEAPAPAPAQADRSQLRAVVIAIVRHNHHISSGEPTSVPQLERYRRQWAADPRLANAHPVLVLNDEQGGFSLHEESSAYIGNIARRLAAEGLLDKEGSAFLPEGMLRVREAAAATASAFHEQTADQPRTEAGPEAVRPAQPDPMEGLKGLFRGIGLDLKVGGVDVVKGVERTARTGNALPLVAGLATAVLAAAAAVEANRED